MSPVFFTLAGIMLIDTALCLILWRSVRNLRRDTQNMRTSLIRADREITQHRYVIALLRQLQNASVTQQDDTTSDEELLDLAVTHLDKIENTTSGTSDAVQAPVDTLKDSEILQFVKKALKNNHIAVMHQPIVELPKRTVRYYEVFSRILVGEQGYIPAHKFISVAKNNHLIGAVDNLLLLRCLQFIKNNSDKVENAEFFINISVQTLSTKNYVQDLVKFLTAHPKLSSRLIFEVTQTDSLEMTPMGKKVIEGLSLLGCRFSMDQVTSFGMNTNRLIEQNISFVKLDTKVLEKEMATSQGRNRIGKIKNMLEAQGIHVIFEKVENDKQLVALLELQVALGQGYLFGKPTAMG